MYSCHINDGSNVNYRVAGTHMVKLFSELPASASAKAISGDERRGKGMRGLGTPCMPGKSDGGGGMIYRFIFASLAQIK